MNVDQHGSRLWVEKTNVTAHISSCGLSSIHGEADLLHIKKAYQPESNAWHKSFSAASFAGLQEWQGLDAAHTAQQFPASRKKRSLFSLSGQ